MSLFFLILTTITYVLSHFWARQTRPQKTLHFSTEDSIELKIQNFQRTLKLWLQNNNHLELIDEKENTYTIHQKPNLLSFGNYYYIKETISKDDVKIQIVSQAKLISNPNSKKIFLNQLASQVELKNVG